MYYMIGNTESNKDSFIQISKKQFDFINNKDNQTIKTKYKDNNITFNENKFKSIYNKQGEGTHINDIVSSMA